MLMMMVMDWTHCYLWWFLAFFFEALANRNEREGKNRLRQLVFCSELQADSSLQTSTLRIQCDIEVNKLLKQRNCIHHCSVVFWLLPLHWLQRLQINYIPRGHPSWRASLNKKDYPHTDCYARAHRFLAVLMASVFFAPTSHSPSKPSRGYLFCLSWNMQ